MFNWLKSEPTYRAGPNSFKAYKRVWVGNQPLRQHLESLSEARERHYQDTLKRCRTQGGQDVYKAFIFGVSDRIIAGNEKAQKDAAEKKFDEADFYEMASYAIVLGNLGNVVFSYAPAVACAQNFDADRVCLDAVERILELMRDSASDLHPVYARTAEEVLSGFVLRLLRQS